MPRASRGRVLQPGRDQTCTPGVAEPPRARRDIARRLSRWLSVLLLCVVMAAGLAAVFSNYGIGVRTNSAGRALLLGVESGRLTLHDSGIQGVQRPFLAGAERRSEAWGWWFEVRRSWVGTFIAVPLWAPLVVAVAWTAFAYRKRRRPDECSACGYERAGLAAGVCCPECGHR